VPYARKIVLDCPDGQRAPLDDMVAQFLRDGVIFVGVVGEDCARIEDMIDALVVGDGSDPDRFILTSSHPGETLEEAVAFASVLTGDYAGPVQVVAL
jgi:hypothetical protein